MRNWELIKNYSTISSFFFVCIYVDMFVTIDLWTEIVVCSLNCYHSHIVNIFFKFSCYFSTINRH